MVTRSDFKIIKRPRGLDALLGHLLDKRISVRYQFTTIVAAQIPLKIQVKSRYNVKVIKNRKCTEWPKLIRELEHLTVRSTLYTLNTYPWGPNFGAFYSATTVAVSEIQGRQKSEMHRMTPNWTWTLNSQKYTVYTKCLPLGPKFWSVLLYD